MSDNSKIINLDNYRRNSSDENSNQIEINIGMADDCICVMCGAYVPEGFQVCPACLKRYSPKKR